MCDWCFFYVFIYMVYIYLDGLFSLALFEARGNSCLEVFEGWDQLITIVVIRHSISKSDLDNQSQIFRNRCSSDKKLCQIFKVRCSNIWFLFWFKSKYSILNLNIQIQHQIRIRIFNSKFIIILFRVFIYGARRLWEHLFIFDLVVISEDRRSREFVPVIRFF